MDCLFKEGEETKRRIEVDGVLSRFGFHPERVQNHAEEISGMLEDLPEQFREHSGGGWSFLQACMDKDGEQWGEHRNIDQLLALGQAIGKAKILLPKQMWSMMPGGMPYFVVLNERQQPEPVNV